MRRSWSERLSGLIPAHAGKTPSVTCDRPGTKAHPRSRGENRAFDVLGVGRMGSSPLTRGKLHRRASRPVNERLIPAHAGKTLTPAGVFVIQGAHPRSRGENWVEGEAELGFTGSSPLTRGKQWEHNGHTFQVWLIPAHAGKTCPTRGDTAPTRAHPRSRGENMPHSRRYSSHAGSSPLTRGKQGRRGRGPHPLGLIPAHAGKTTVVTRSSQPRGAHPRSRGENLCS